MSYFLKVAKYTTNAVQYATFSAAVIFPDFALWEKYYLCGDDM